MWAYTSHTHHTHTHLPFVYTQIVLDGSANSSTQLCVFTLAPLQSSIGPSSVCKASSYSSYYSSFKLINSQKDCSFYEREEGDGLTQTNYDDSIAHSNQVMQGSWRVNILVESIFFAGILGVFIKTCKLFIKSFAFYHQLVFTHKLN